MPVPASLSMITVVSLTLLFAKVSGEAGDSTATTRGGTGGATQRLGSSSGIRRAQTLPPRLECEEEVTSGD